jgi:phosphatidylserine decarboxylase
LKSKRPGKKTGNVTGAVQLQFSIVDPENPDADSQQILQKLSAIVGTGMPDSRDEGYGPNSDEDDDDDDQDGQVTPGELEGGADGATKKKRRLKITRIKNKAKQRGYEFTNGSPVAGVLFIEIQRITDLPPERNGELLSDFSASD